MDAEQSSSRDLSAEVGKSRAGWRQALDESGVSIAAMRARLNTHIEESRPAHRPRKINSAERFLHWYREGLGVTEAARQAGITENGMIACIQAMASVALNPAYDFNRDARERPGEVTVEMSEPVIETVIELPEESVEGETVDEPAVEPPAESPVEDPQSSVEPWEDDDEPTAEPPETVEVSADTIESLDIEGMVNILMERLKFPERYRRPLFSLIDPLNRQGMPVRVTQDEARAVLALRRRVFESHTSIDNLHVPLLAREIIRDLLGGEVKYTDSKPKGPFTQEIVLDSPPQPGRQQALMGDQRDDRKVLQFKDAMNAFVLEIERLYPVKTSEEPEEPTTGIIEE